jgi:hypothetical protein
LIILLLFLRSGGTIPDLIGIIVFVKLQNVSLQLPTNEELMTIARDLFGRGTELVMAIRFIIEELEGPHWWVISSKYYNGQSLQSLANIHRLYTYHHFS